MGGAAARAGESSRPAGGIEATPNPGTNWPGEAAAAAAAEAARARSFWCSSMPLYTDGAGDGGVAAAAAPLKEATSWLREATSQPAAATAAATETTWERRTGVVHILIGAAPLPMAAALARAKAHTAQAKHSKETQRMSDGSSAPEPLPAVQAPLPRLRAHSPAVRARLLGLALLGQDGDLQLRRRAVLQRAGLVVWHGGGVSVALALGQQPVHELGQVTTDAERCALSVAGAVAPAQRVHHGGQLLGEVGGVGARQSALHDAAAARSRRVALTLVQPPAAPQQVGADIAGAGFRRGAGAGFDWSGRLRVWRAWLVCLRAGSRGFCLLLLQVGQALGSLHFQRVPRLAQQVLQRLASAQLRPCILLVLVVVLLQPLAVRVLRVRQVHERAAFRTLRPAHTSTAESTGKVRIRTQPRSTKSTATQQNAKRAH